MKENNEFNDYIEKFKLLPLQTKKEKTIDEIKLLLATIEKLKTDININEELIFNREILDSTSDNISDDDFVEAVFVYIHMIEESFGHYANKIIEILYKEEK